VWDRFLADVADLTPDEAEWRPLPQANSINVILRHLRIEAEWHLASLEHGVPMPGDVTPELQRKIDSVGLDVRENMNELTRLFSHFVAVLREGSLAKLQAQTERAYAAAAKRRPVPPHYLGVHQASHLATHLGPIRTLPQL